ncbi:4Fe-4S dicluster domain-containing protein [Shigella flexneri]
MYLPRLCEHCLNPSCVATCPSALSTTRRRRHCAH